MEKLVERHAQLVTGIKRCIADGKQPPAKAIHELNRIESRAQAMLTTREMQQAMAASRSLQAQYYHQAEQKRAVSEARDQEFFQRKLTKDWTGYTPEQIAEIQKTGHYTVQPKFNAEATKKRIEKMVKAIDPSMTFAKFDALATEVDEARNHGRTANLKRFKNPEKLLKAVEGYLDSGAYLPTNLANERPRTYQVDEQDRLRLDIATNIATAAMHGNEEAQEAIRDEIDPAYTSEENQSLQGDIARAMQTCEMREMAEERSSYE